MSSTNQKTLMASAMTRTTSKAVTFTRPFVLSAIVGRQAAGTYTVETDEELLGSLSFPAYRRTGTWMRLRSSESAANGAAIGLDRLVNVDASELDKALASDVASLPGEDATASLPSSATAHPDVSAGGAASTSAGARESRASSKFTLQDWLTLNNSDLTWIALAALGLLILGFLMSFDLPAR